MGQNPYSPHTDADRAAMLARIGIESVDELLSAVPKDARGPAMGVPAGLSELEVQAHLERLAMDVVNASMYDGSTAVAEAALMAVRLTGRKRVVVANEVFSQFRETLATYAKGPELEIVTVATRELAAGAAGAACLIVQHPDAFGTLVDVRAIADAAHAAGGLCVQVTEPHANALLEPPGALGVDIAVGEGQPLGIAMSFGGPYLGILACRLALVRQMPGRIVGETHDARGMRGFVNTLQTREQHIRREKATSNICTNEAIAAITAAVYLGLMGPEGLRAAARPEAGPRP